MEILGGFKDVCSVLEIGNSRDVMARLDSDEKESILSTPLEENRKYLLSMSGLYSVILVFESQKLKSLSAG